MMSQKELIHNTDWDILLVLDAIRFDIFQQHYRGIFSEGSLQCCESPTTFTLGWIKEIFGNQCMKNTIFISSDPVRDLIRDYTKRAKHGRKFDMRDHFKAVIDTHSTSFREPGYIEPETINQFITDTIENYPNDRLVVKYWQAHDPYIYWIKRGFDPKLRSKGYGNIRKIIYEIIDDEKFWTICSKLNFLPENWLAALWLEHGRDAIILGYTSDLLLCLKHCKEIVDSFPKKKIIITSDHGERLGPRYSHGGRRTKEIKNVPWLTLHKTKGGSMV